MKKVLILLFHLIACTIYAQVPGGDLLMGLHQIESADISNISNPIEGTIFYNTTEKQIYVYDGTVWKPLSDNGWALDGNSISTTDFIGSTNDQDLVFKTNSLERMRLNSDRGQLQINNASVYNSHPLIIRANGNDVLAFQDNTGNTKWHWNLKGDGLNFVETAVKDYRLFLQNGGNVGIDTGNPQRKLEVNGIIRSGEGSSTTGTTIIEGKYTGDNVTALMGTKRSSGNLVLGYGVRPNNTAANYISSANNVSFQRSALEVGNGLSFQASNGPVNAPINDVVPLIELFKISPDGNTGIGTSSPNYKLEVNGTAKIEDTPTITTATKALVKDPSSGQISEQEISSFTINGKYSINFSGRAFFFSTLWYGPHNQYGVAYQNWNAAKTNAVTPAYSTDDQFGLPIASNVTLAKFSMKNDFDTVPTTPSINLGVIRNGVVINIGTYEITNPSTTITIQTTDVGFPLLEGDLLVWATKSAAGGTRYSYASLTFEFTY